MNMELTRKQFDILEALAMAGSSLTQREIATKTKYSVGTINKVLKELMDLDYYSGKQITTSGYMALAPYRVKRAIFIAAGFGTRLVPITFNTPKPLVRVHGIRIIDRLIDACLAAGINEIYIVRGYLSELFDQLLYKYPMIKFLENPVYNEDQQTSTTEETDTEGGKRTISSVNNKREVVYANNNVVTESISSPQIQGAVIIARGANNTRVKADIIQAVAAATGLSTYKIQVFEMN